MGIVVLITALLALATLKINFKNNEIQPDYLSFDHSNAVKGIFVVFIVLVHFQQYVPTANALIDYPFIFIREWVGQLIVTPFMFVSGYGVLKSFDRKQHAYLRSFPQRRILKTQLHFAIGIGLFLIANLLFGEKYSVIEYLTALVGWNPVGNSNWYIFAILVLYAITWISGLITERIRPNNKIALATIITVGVLLYILIISQFKGRVFYNTVICYPVGMWFALLESQIVEKCKKWGGWTLAVVALLTMFVVAMFFCPIYSVKAAIFPLMIFVITMRFTINSKCLIWLGKHTFSIYMLQRLPMMIYKKIGLASYNEHLYLFVVLMTTIAIAWAFDLAMQKVDARFQITN